MARNPAAQTAFGPMVQAAIEQYEPPERRLVSDDLALSILPAGQRAIACRKRYIDDKLDEAQPNIDSVVVLGAGMDTRAYRLARRSDIPVFEVDLPVNIARKKAAVAHAIGAVPASVRLVPVDLSATT
jgi:methyltransferase (TIGR00027 family)